jgi:hypothetical protein
MSKETRLARLEGAFPEPHNARPKIELMQFMTIEELLRLCGIVRRIEGDAGVTNEQDLADCKKLYAVASQRQLAGLSSDDVRKLEERRKTPGD